LQPPGIGLRKRFLKRAKNVKIGEEQPNMAARVRDYVPTMRQRFPGKLVRPERPGFDFDVRMIELALDSWS